MVAMENILSTSSYFLQFHGCLQSYTAAGAPIFILSIPCLGCHFLEVNMDERILKILVKIEAMKTERTALETANKEREIRGEALSYPESVFNDLAKDMYGLLGELK